MKALYPVLFVATLWLTVSSRLNAATINAYPRPAIYSASTVYSLRADGISIPVTSYTGDYDYAAFSMTGGSAVIEVTGLTLSSITSYSISPKKLNLTGTVSGNKLTFTLAQDEYLIVQLDGLRRLVIAADPADTPPAASGTGIFNVTASPYNADSTGATMTTVAIQNAINAASAYGGGQGIVYVPAGVYKVGNLELKNDTALYLAPGSVFVFSGNPADYTNRYFKDSQGRWVTWWLWTTFGADNVKIYGRGTLDGNGLYATSTYNYACNILVPIGTSNFTLEGPILRDSGAWSLTPARSNNLTIRNVKLFNRLNIGENDGIDVCESQNVTVQHCIGIGLDDPFTTKTWAATIPLCAQWPGSPENVDTVLFEDLISWTVCYGYKIGMGVIQTQNNVTFRNNVVYDCSVGIGIAHSAGTTAATNITFENIDIERVTWTNAGQRTWASFFVENVDATYGAGPITGLLVKDILVRDEGTTIGRLKGYSSTAMLTGATFNNVVMPGSAVPAQNLFQMNLLDRAYCSAPTILPVQIAEPVSRVNLALGKSAVASSSAGSSTPGLVIDGTIATRWGSAYTDNEWIYIDLGAAKPLNGVRLWWEGAYASAYQLQVSNDAATWTTVYSTSAGAGGVEDINFAPATGRYVRMLGIARATSYGYSIWEFEVYGPEAIGNLASSATVTATSTVENSNWGLARAKDGQWYSVPGSMGWTSNNSLTTNHTESVTFDLGSSQLIGRVDLFPRSDTGNIGQNFPIDFTIKTSPDNAAWTTRVTRTGYAQPDNSRQSFAFAAASARYVRIEGTNLRPNPNDANRYRMAFPEVEIYAPGNLARAAAVSATSTVENASWGFTKVNDGQRNSVSGSYGWTSNDSLTINHTESITLDLGASLTIGRVDLYPRNDSGNVGQNFPIDFTIQTSPDNATWTTRVVRTGYAQPGNAVQTFTFSAASARYVKIQGTNLRPNPGDANRYRMAFAEIELYYGP